MKKHLGGPILGDLPDATDLAFKRREKLKMCDRKRERDQIECTRPCLKFIIDFRV